MQLSAATLRAISATLAANGVQPQPQGTKRERAPLSMYYGASAAPMQALGIFELNRQPHVLLLCNVRGRWYPAVQAVAAQGTQRALLHLDGFRSVPA